MRYLAKPVVTESDCLDSSSLATFQISGIQKIIFLKIPPQGNTPYFLTQNKQWAYMYFTKERVREA